MKKLNLCCGTDLKNGWDNADIQKNKKILYCDINVFPYPFKDNTYDYILIKGAFYYAEHPEKVLDELRRIAKDKGRIRIENTPYYNNKGSVTCMGTKSFFSETTFKYFVNCSNGEHYCYFPSSKKFEILELTLKPTFLGALIHPIWLRNKLSCIIGGLISHIDVELKIIK